MAEKVTVFIHDGIVEGVFSSSPDTSVCIIDYDRDLGEQEIEDARWEACQESGMHLITPEIDHCEEE